MIYKTRTCQNCKAQFVIEPDDLAFYERIKVPSPTWCPECRHVRRLTWTHSFNLYRRKCDVPGHTEDIIAKYPASSKVTVYDSEYWWSDKWDPLEFGFEYDFSRPFFPQLDTLFRTVPICNSDVNNSVDCDYCIVAQNCKNCYFIGGGFRSEDCLYTEVPPFCKNVVDSYHCIGSDTLYDCLYCDGSFDVRHSAFCEGCMSSAFIYNCAGCSNCFGCVNLRNKKYCIFNRQYSKEEYFQKVKEFDISSRDGFEKARELFSEFKLQNPRRFADIVRSVDCTGDIIEGGKNCKKCFAIRQGAENCKYMVLAGVGTKDSYDVYGGGLTSALLYECKSATGSERVFFSGKIANSHDIYYSLACDDCSDLFGCISLRHRKYCIFNRQYSKEEYKRTVPGIIAQMSEMPYVNSRGIKFDFGEFLPPEFSPVPYNESLAQVYYPLDQRQASDLGYSWNTAQKREFDATLSSEEIPDSISKINDDILSQIVECAHRGRCRDNCLEFFKIIPQELEFYRKMNIPLPLTCPVCRNKERMEELMKLNPFRMGRRQCQCDGAEWGARIYKNKTRHFHGNDVCSNEFETLYAPDRSEILYCEQCYQAEVA